VLLFEVRLLEGAGAGEESHAERMVGSDPLPSAMLRTVFGAVSMNTPVTAMLQIQRVCCQWSCFVLCY